MPLYFAYGANMDVSAMAERCPKSRALGPARLNGHRFFIMTRGYASVVRDPRAVAHGLLWELALADVPALDRYEEVARGLYRKAALPVFRRDAAPVRALVYVGGVAEEGLAEPGYIETVIRAGSALGLPSSYISHLESFSPARRRA
jgi:gamma-glutamylcyclotransferase (GGCT)/AIG2-like uncharacterized protein YtfP